MQCPRHFFMGSMRQPTQMQCLRYFFMGSKYHPRQRRISRESDPPSTANRSFAYMELTSLSCVRLWGPWKTIFRVMSHKKRAQVGYVISIFLMFLAHQL